MDYQNAARPTATTFTIEDLLKDVQSGKVRIPEFQRAFRWQAKDVERLLESIWFGYPIGSLLLWERPASAAEIKIGSLVISAPAKDHAFWMVDGQQRITSLANTLIEHENPDKRFALSFDLQAKRFVPFRKNEQDFVVPLPTVVDLQKLLRWFSVHPEAKEFLDTASALAKSIREYRIPAYLVQSSDERALRDIFDRMNNYGKRLSRAEVFHSLHGGSDQEEISFKSIADQIEAKFGFGRIDEDTIMSTVLARRGSSTFRDIRQEFDVGNSTSEFEESRREGYEQGAQALERAVDFLQQDAHVPHISFLPYRYLLSVLTRYFAHFPAPKARNIELLRRWFWRAVVIGPDAMKGRTPALKKCLVRIQPGKEDESIQSLLALLSDVHRNIDQFTVTIVPDNFRTNAANSRILLCALWQLKPRSCVGAQEPYTLKDLSNNLEGEVTAKKATYSLVRKAKNSEAGLIIRLRIGYEEEVELFDFLFDFGFAENVVRAEIDYSDPFSIPRQQDVADAWLKSHCLNVGVLTQLLSGDEQDFLRARSALLEQLVTEFVSTNTAWDFEDTPPLGSLFFEDEEEDDSDIDEDENEVDDGIHA